MLGRRSGRRSGRIRSRRADHEQRGRDHVDPQPPPPRVVGGEEPADQRAERHRRARHRAPRRERDRARSAPTKVVDRIESVAGMSSDAPIPSMIASPSTSVGTECETDARNEPMPKITAPDDEHAAVAVHVAEPAADDQERRERQRVAGDHPLEAREVGVELAQDRRNRDVQDCVVEYRDGRPTRSRPPLPTTVWGRARAGRDRRRPASPVYLHTQDFCSPAASTSGGRAIRAEPS